MDRMNNNYLWVGAITKEIYSFDRLVFAQTYLPKTKFENSYGWQWSPMRIIFDIKEKYLRHKARLVLRGYVVPSSEHTTLLLTIKDISVRFMLMIAVKNGLVLMAGDTGNAFCTALCVENILSKCGMNLVQDFGAIVVLKRALYGLKNAYKSFRNFFGEFLRDIGFTSSRADQDLWLDKSDKYDGYDYIATHVYDIIIAENNPYKYMD